MLQRIAVVGSRTGVSQEKVVEFVNRLDPEFTVLISGGAQGVDTWAAEAAEARGIRTVIILPNWKKYGKGAGLRRNTEIVLAADDVIAYWDMRSRGTFDTIKKALKHKRNLVVFNGEGNVVEHFDMSLLPPPPKMAIPKGKP